MRKRSKLGERTYCTSRTFDRFSTFDYLATNEPDDHRRSNGDVFGIAFG